MNLSAKIQRSNIIRKGVPDVPHLKKGALDIFAPPFFMERTSPSSVSTTFTVESA